MRFRCKRLEPLAMRNINRLGVSGAFVRNLDATALTDVRNLAARFV